MKILIIFYSFEGNTKLIAENIAKTINADILELKLKKETTPKGFMKYFWGGKEAIMKTKPELLPFDKNIQDYDILFIGTPVWAWTYAPPLNTLFSTCQIVNKKIALFCCCDGQKGKTFDQMKKALENNQILGEIDFQEPLKNNTDANIQRANKWAEDKKAVAYEILQVMAKEL
ncbi:MAG: flavodoxin [bacterium]|nr:flavodoxin [bacterium]